VSVAAPTHDPVGSPSGVRAPAAASPSHRAWARRARSIAPPAIVAGAVLGVWCAISYLVLAPRRRFLLPPPQDVIRNGFLDADNRGELLGGLAGSARVAVVGLAVAIVIGTAFAVLMSQSRWVERSFYPWAVVLQTIPILALVPLVGFWFEYGFNSRVLVCVLISLFPIITNTLFGLKSADRAHRDLFRLRRASRWQRLVKLELPGALPSMFTGWRISAGLSVIGAIVGDFFFRQGDAGLGRLIDGYTAQLQSDQLFAAVIVSSLLGLSVFWLFGLLSRLVVGSWHESAAVPEED
jgi:NitT/TauT family transport system permease protein